MGKSRLMFDVLENKNTLPQSIGQCFPTYQNHAMDAILRLVSDKLSLNGLPDEMVVAGVHDFIQQTRGKKRREQRNALPILLTWLDVALPDDIAPSTASAQNPRKSPICSC